MKYNVNVIQNGVVIKTIKRMLRVKDIGNFNPVFCTYRKKEYLVNSVAGDLSDPFRREQSYLETLYIEV